MINEIEDFEDKVNEVDMKAVTKAFVKELMKQEVDFPKMVNERDRETISKLCDGFLGELDNTQRKTIIVASVKILNRLNAK